MGTKNNRSKKKNKTVSVKRSAIAAFSFAFVALLAICVFFAASSFSAVSENEQLKTTIENLNNKVNTLDEQYKSLSEEADALEELLDLVQIEKDDSEESASLLTQRLKEIETAVKTLEKDKKALSDSLSAMETEKKTLEEQYKSSSEQSRALEQKYNDLLKNYNSVSSKYEQILDKYNALSTQLKSLENIEPAELFDDHSSLDKVCYLTFDDGPSTQVTPVILDILKQNGVKATFFVNKKGSKFDYLYKRIVNEGHTIGNHTATHTYETVYTNLAGFMKEFDDLQQHVYKLTGKYPQVFRFPGGGSNSVHKKYNANIMPLAIEALEQIGVNYFDWNINSTDADAPNQPVENIIQAATKVGNKKRVIILMHDLGSKQTTAEALPEIIRILREKGFEFRSLNNNVTPIHHNVKK